MDYYEPRTAPCGCGCGYELVEAESEVWGVYLCYVCPQCGVEV